jgi:hypothetical protein
MQIFYRANIGTYSLYHWNAESEALAVIQNQRVRYSCNHWEPDRATHSTKGKQRISKEESTKDRCFGWPGRDLLDFG